MYISILYIYDYFCVDVTWCLYESRAQDFDLHNSKLGYLSVSIIQINSRSLRKYKASQVEVRD